MSSWHRRTGAWGAVAVVASLAAVLGSMSCGYSLVGRGSFLPEHIRTIGVPLFLNQTAIFEVEQRLTERIRSELIGRGRYRIIPETATADAALLGTITSIAIAPASFTQDRQATRYQFTVTVSVEFRDLVSDTLIWSNPALTFQQEYEVTTGADALDPNAFFGQSSNAVERLAQDFARTVVSAILEAF